MIPATAPGPVEPSRLPARPAGALLGTIAALSAVGGAAMAAYASYELFARDLAARDVVGKVRKLRDAGESWARTHYGDLLNDAGANGPVELPLPDLVAIGLLPANFDPVDSYGQRYRVLVRRSPIPAPLGNGTPAAKLVDGQLEILVAGTGGRPMPDARARYTATVLGGGAAVTRAEPDLLRGAYDGWSVPASAWATASLPAPQPGSVASLLVLHPGELQMEYLHRFAVPGAAIYNRMGAPIVFGAGGLRNVARAGTRMFGIVEQLAALDPANQPLGRAYGSCDAGQPFDEHAPIPLRTIAAGTVLRDAAAGSIVPTSCTSFHAPAGVPSAWIPWQVIGADGGLPTQCAGPLRALQWDGSAWICGTLPPLCASTGVPQSNCPQFCPSTGTYLPQGQTCAPLPYCAYFGYPALPCPTPPPPTTTDCPDGSIVPYGGACPPPPAPYCPYWGYPTTACPAGAYQCPPPDYQFVPCPGGLSPGAMERDYPQTGPFSCGDSGWYVTGQCHTPESTCTPDPVLGQCHWWPDYSWCSDQNYCPGTYQFLCLGGAAQSC